jgi:hypothetical protein
MSKITRHEFSWLSGLFIALAISAAFAAPARGASWSTPVAPPAGCGTALAVNAAGAMVLAGFSQTGSGLEAFSVEVCTSGDGVHWSGPTTIGQGVAPAVAIAPDGRAVAIWQGGPATMPNVQAAVRPVGESWSAPVLVSGIPGHPVIAMDGVGNAIAAWGGTTLATPAATASLRAGGSWTTARTLVAQGSGVSIATNAVGGAIVTWRTHANLIQVASGTVLGALGPPITLGTTYGHSTQGAHGALNDAGMAVLGWKAANANVVVTRTSAGAWSPATQLSANPAGIDTAIDGAGNAIAVFAVSQPSGTPTFASRRPAGGTWGPPTLLSALNDLGGAAAGGDAAGTFVVTWTNSAGAVEALTIPPGGGFGPGTVVGAGPFRHLLVVPGQAVLSIGAGIAKEAVR